MHGTLNSQFRELKSYFRAERKKFRYANGFLKQAISLPPHLLKHGGHWNVFCFVSAGRPLPAWNMGRTHLI
jgi:hypothetical protein